MSALDRLRSALAARYREPHRHHHDLRHLHDVLEAVDLLSAEAPDLEAVRWAAWFHDAVYDPRASDNEQRSAALAEHELHRYGVAPATVGEVVRLVRLTSSHDPAPGDRNGAVLCDADLAVLASSPDRYRDYTAGVRAEHADLEDVAFAAGRTAVLTRLLQRDRLYSTATGWRLWEDRARSNLSAELARLRARV